MPDRRTHRGPHPEDARLFAAPVRATLVQAMEEYAYLLSRGYGEPSARALVGNRHGLTARQRMALRRSACTDEALERRQRTRRPLSECLDQPLGIDGYNLLITIESALSGGVILIGRDGCARDLASVHGTYRRVSETLPAIRLIAGHLAEARARMVDLYLDRPVSNSGRLKTLMRDTLSGGKTAWRIELVDNPDAALSAYSGPVVSSDSWILDRCNAWVNLAREIIERHIPNGWIVDLVDLRG
ncbi:MAG: DUF434 domain-containing protein [Phycisphaerae bacterium]